METITVKTEVYKFSELSDEAQKKVLEGFSQGDNYCWDDDNRETLKAFEQVFNVKHTDYTYGGYSPCFINYELNYDDEVLELKGIRLLKYIINNYYDNLYKGKYYGTLIPHQKDKDHPAGLELVKYYSKCQKDNDCVLTGYCMDYAILKPIYDFIKKPDKDTNIEDVLNDCMQSFINSCNEEWEYANSEESIIETIEANDYDFTIDGEMF